MSGQNVGGVQAADDVAWHRADATEPVGAAAFEIIGIPRSKDPALIIDCDLQPPGQDNPAFLAVMHQRHFSSVCAGLIAFLQDLKAAAEQVIADLPVGNRPLADLDQFVGPVKRFLRPIGLEGKKLRKPDRDTVENALQRADGWVGRIGLDQRNRRVGHAGPAWPIPAVKDC